MTAASCSGLPHPPSTWRGCARDFPILAQRGPRQAAGLSRQRRHHAEAAGGDRRASSRYYTRRQRQRPPRRAHPLASAPPRPTRARARRCARFLNAPQREGDRLRARHHRGDQPGGADLGPAATSAPGDEILITGLEHHSNIVPWQMLCEEKGATLRVVARQRRAASCVLDEFEKLLTPRTRLVAVGARLERARHDQPGARDDRAGPRARARSVLVDGAQAVPHLPVDVQDAGLRLLRLLRPQGLRPDAASACSTARRSCSRPCRRARAAAT